ncbi:MAG TPA: rRNA maturation RNase YbeY [Chitinophagaceae bacterium]|nr:rRNA maturation RNase YbeY [Chitinophagaceae bacterium]
MSKVYFHTQGVKNIPLPPRKSLKLFIEEIFKNENTSLNRLDYVFCNDEYLLQINKQFLQHDYYTDIITFRLSEKSLPVIGEIYISIERVRENAKLFNVSFAEEMLRVIFHGALHLSGFNDKTRQQINRMRAKEDEYLLKYKYQFHVKP